MSRAGWTRKPCEGCGAEGHRRTGQVCRECELLLRDGEAYRAEFNNRALRGKVAL